MIIILYLLFKKGHFDKFKLKNTKTNYFLNV